MRKLSRKETAKINGGIRPDQCFYTDPNTGQKKVGCRNMPFQDENGTWVYPLVECEPCGGI
ncbi:hypothetical protein [Chryseobacterium hagamense]|uniref:Bacteriocin n=1 Tax=Chryseobacterium hagamense TaxID=395935 RepID=A0A511YRV8_9FLAO|nr:hypothetical protein [Chryseobacterium hagamense]GEN77927.1 hypothetical protein CHA01nite_36670 [Chryseobacterium hagamense]